MYTITELARKYMVSRGTIYTLLEHKEIQPYIVRGKRKEAILQDEGINTFQLLLSQTNAGKRKVNKPETTPNIGGSSLVHSLLIEQFEARLKEKDILINKLETSLSKAESERDKVFEQVLTFFAQQKSISDGKKSFWGNVIKNVFKNKK